MTQKVIDIRHPSFSKKEKDFTPRKKRRWLSVLLLVFLLVLAGSYFKVYRVDVKVWPVMEDFQFSEVVEVYAFEDSEIAVQHFDETVEGERNFEVLGKSLVEVKTEGVVNVCQEYSDAVQPIREGTRFVCEKGKLFIGNEAFTIPGRSYDGGDVVPGCVEVSVTAAETGEEYNISSSSRFSLPGLQGTALYGSFYGESFSITKEGKSEEVPYLTSEEIAKAEEILLDELFEKGKTILKNRLRDDFMIDDRGQYNKVVIERSLPTEGEKDSFSVAMKVRIEVIAVKEDTATEFLKNSLPKGFAWHEKNVNYEFMRANFEDKSGEMEISLEAQIYKDMDINSLKRSLVGVSFTEAVEELESREEIKKVSLRFYPLGPSFVPRSTKRISVELLFDKD